MRQAAKDLWNTSGTSNAKKATSYLKFVSTCSKGKANKYRSKKREEQCIVQCFPECCSVLLTVFGPLFLHWCERNAILKYSNRLFQLGLLNNNNVDRFHNERLFSESETYRANAKDSRTNDCNDSVPLHGNFKLRPLWMMYSPGTLL